MKICGPECDYLFTNHSREYTLIKIQVITNMYINQDYGRHDYLRTPLTFCILTM